MRATIAWSYELLDPGEQTLFQLLSVFSSGCAPEAVAALVRATDAHTGDVLAGLHSLVEKSLV